MHAAAPTKAVERPVVVKNLPATQQSYAKKIMRNARHMLPYVALLSAYFARQELRNIFVRNNEDSLYELLVEASKEVGNKVFDTMITVLIIKSFIEAHGQTIKDFAGISESATC